MVVRPLDCPIAENWWVWCGMYYAAPYIMYLPQQLMDQRHHDVNTYTGAGGATNELSE